MMGLRSCREISELASQKLDRELGFRERLALGLHFRICKGCRRFSRQMAFLRGALERLPEDDPQARAAAQRT
jgi:hypothetical protein